MRRKSQNAQEHDNQKAEAVLGVQNKKYKSSYEAAKLLGVCERTVQRHVKGISLTRTEARQKQQLLSKIEEKTLLKWIKELTASGYAPSHRILREVAEEVRSNKCRVFQTQVSRLTPWS